MFNYRTHNQIQLSPNCNLELNFFFFNFYVFSLAVLGLYCSGAFLVVVSECYLAAVVGLLTLWRVSRYEYWAIQAYRLH